MPTTHARDTTLNEAVAAQIRAERAAARLTQAEVYTAAGIPRSTYIRLEAAQHTMDVAQLAAIAPVFNMTLSELLRRAEARVAEAVGPHGGRKKK